MAHTDPEGRPHVPPTEHEHVHGELGHEHEHVYGRRTGAVAVDGDRPEDFWRDRTRIFLRPVAPPSILAWLAWAGPAFVIGADLAWGYGGTNSLTALAPFVLAMGIAQLLAALRGYPARDGVITGFHGMWGALWIAVGLLFGLLRPLGFVTFPTEVLGEGNLGQLPELGYYFVIVGAASIALGIAGFAKSLLYGLTMILAGCSAVFLFIEAIAETDNWGTVAGWVFLGTVVGAVLIATLTALGYATNNSGPIKGMGPAPARNVTGELEGRILVPVAHEHGEPGVRQGEGARSD